MLCKQELANKKPKTTWNLRRRWLCDNPEMPIIQTGEALAVLGLLNQDFRGICKQGYFLVLIYIRATYYFIIILKREEIIKAIALLK